MPYVSDQSLMREVRAQESAAQQAYKLSLANAGKITFELPASFPYRPLRVFETPGQDQLSNVSEYLNKAYTALMARDQNSFIRLVECRDIGERIRFNQKITAYRAAWLDANIQFLYYQRVQFLFSWFQKDFFYRNAIQSVKNISKIAGWAVYQSKYDALLQESTENGILNIDSYAKLYHSPHNEFLQCWLDYIEKSPYNPRAYEKRFLPTEERNKFKVIIQNQIQLSQLSKRDNRYKTVMTMFRENSLAVESINEAITTTTVSSLKHESQHYRFMSHLTDEFNTSVNDSKAIKNKYERQLISIIQSCNDVVELEKKINEVISVQKNICKIMHDNQNSQINLYRKRNDSHEEEAPLPSGEANVLLSIDLNDPQFYVLDKQGVSCSLLHIAMNQFEDATNLHDSTVSMNCIKILLRRGCSPYNEKSNNQSALNDSKVIKDWDFAIELLSNLSPKVILTERLRHELLRYCRTSAMQVKRWSWRLFHSTTIKESRLEVIHILIKIISDKINLESASKIKSEILKQIQTFRQSKPNNSQLNAIMTAILDIDYEDKSATKNMTRTDIQLSHLQQPDTFFTQSARLKDVTNTNVNQTEYKY